MNLDFFCPRLTPEARAAKRAALGIPPERAVIVYLGLLADYQGVPQLLAALARLRCKGMPVSCLVMVSRRRGLQRARSRDGVDGTGRGLYRQDPVRPGT